MEKWTHYKLIFGKIVSDFILKQPSQLTFLSGKFVSLISILGLFLGKFWFDRFRFDRSLFFFCHEKSFIFWVIFTNLISLFLFFLVNPPLLFVIGEHFFDKSVKFGASSLIQMGPKWPHNRIDQERVNPKVFSLQRLFKKDIVFDPRMFRGFDSWHVIFANFHNFAQFSLWFSHFTNHLRLRLLFEHFHWQIGLFCSWIKRGLFLETTCWWNLRIFFGFLIGKLCLLSFNLDHFSLVFLHNLPISVLFSSIFENHRFKDLYECFYGPKVTYRVQ